MVKEIVLKLSMEKASWMKEQILDYVRHGSGEDEDLESWMDFFQELKEAMKYPIGDDNDAT
jgi:hypothetical protein